MMHHSNPNGSGATQSADLRLGYRKVVSAWFYAVSSLLLTTVNKSILTSYGFPSFEILGFGQILSTVIVARIGKALSVISFPDFDLHIAKKLWPLSLLFVGNLYFGLGGTQKVSLPMFTVLRRFTILFTMIAEFALLRVRPSMQIQLSVYGMIAGAVIAASDDLNFNSTGYIFLLMNDIFTAINGVYLKKILNAKELGEYGLLFYNSAFVVLPAFFFVLLSGEFDKAYHFGGWTNVGFLSQFFLSCVMGFVINFSIVLCTSYNSALTTNVVGALKNILTVYIGMTVGGDYLFSWINFAGLNVSIVSSLFYSYVVFFETEAKKEQQLLPASTV